MSGLLLTTIVKVLLPAISIGGILFATHRLKIKFGEDLGFKMPQLGLAAAIILLWVLLLAVEEMLSAGAGIASAKRWPDYAMNIVVLRVIAIGVLGPIAEELIFRGMVMHLLRRARLGIYGAILIAAACFAIIHVQYQPLVLTLIFVDGVAFGLARHFSGSIYVPMVMHIMGNLFSLWQSLTG